jgi:hypothetical protein
MKTESVYSFLVSGISPCVVDEFRQLSDEELKSRRVVRRVVDSKPGFPCRVTLEDADMGETVFLLNFEHLPGQSPYRSVGPIFVRESATQSYSKKNEIPDVLRVPNRLFSMRAYDHKDMLAAAEVIETAEVDQSIQRLFNDARVAYIHVHNARPGCYACRIDRA